MSETLEFTLTDGNDPEIPGLKGRAHVGADGILWIAVDGYGDHCSNNGDGLPIGIGQMDGKLQLYLWPDINEEDHQMIDMEGALESARNPEPN